MFRALAGRVGDRRAAFPTGRRARARTGSSGSSRCFSSRPQFEVGAAGSRRVSARCRGCGCGRTKPRGELRFELARLRRGRVGSCRAFRVLKRDGVVPVAASASRCPADAARACERVRRPRAPGGVEPATRRHAGRARGDPARDPARPARACSGTRTSSSACWRASFPVWFEDVKGGILERLLRIAAPRAARRRARVPLLLGHDEQTATARAGGPDASWSRSRTRCPRARPPAQLGAHARRRAGEPTTSTRAARRAAAAGRRPSSTSALLHAGRASRATAAADRGRAGPPAGSASPRLAAGAACRLG